MSGIFSNIFFSISRKKQLKTLANRPRKIWATYTAAQYNCECRSQNRTTAPSARKPDERRGGGDSTRARDFHGCVNRKMTVLRNIEHACKIWGSSASLFLVNFLSAAPSACRVAQHCFYSKRFPSPLADGFYKSTIWQCIILILLYGFIYHPCTTVNCIFCVSVHGTPWLSNARITRHVYLTYYFYEHSMYIIFYIHV